MGDTGLENDRKVSGKSQVSQVGDAKSDAIDANLTRSGLQTLIHAWPHLSNSVRAEIISLIVAARKG
jgi:hypothetical protein